MHRSPRSNAVRAASRILAGAALAFSAGCDHSSPVDPGTGGNGTETQLLTEGTERYGYHVVNRFPHDTDAFTQGLVLHEDVLYEGTGRRGESSLRRVDLETGAVLQRHDLASHLFGEGITVFGDRIIQLTFTSEIGFVYDLESFADEGQFSYDTQGWGITHDGTRLIMSDGTPNLYFMDPESFEVESQVVVFDDGEPIVDLNELEYVEGYVLANVWRTDRIAVIDPAEGEVVSWIDLDGLLTAGERAAADVLNGIAFDPETNHLYVTGKLWPHLFEIVLVPSGG